MSSFKTSLKGVVVLDISRLLPGGFTSMHLTQLGARVIKVEQPGVGDYYRALLPGDVNMGGGHFEVLHAGQEALSLDLKQLEGKAVFFKLCRKADVVLESFRPGTLQRLGLGYPVLKKTNPKLILCSITGYGQVGPQAHLAGHDLNFLARSGLLDMLGSRETLPDFQMVDLATGSMATQAILAALYARQKNKRGQWLDVSMDQAARQWAQVYRHPQRGWSRSPLGGGFYRYGVYQAQDGWVALGALEPKFWNRFCEVVKHPEWMDPAFSLASDETLFKQLQDLFRLRSASDWVKLGTEHDLCITEVKAMFQVSPAAGKSAPLLGGQSDKILRSLGYSSQAIRDLKVKQVI